MVDKAWVHKDHAKKRQQKSMTYLKWPIQPTLLVTFIVIFFKLKTTGC